MKTIVITGATRGLGFAVSKQLLSEGYRVIATGRSLSEELKELCGQFTKKIFFEPFDFNEIKNIHEFSNSLISNYGRIWGLINNAAIGNDGVLATMHESDIAQILRINVEAPILLTKYLIRPMLINRSGRIVNISSIIATTGFSGLSVYGATKAAISGFTFTFP